MRSALSFLVLLFGLTACGDGAGETTENGEGENGQGANAELCTASQRSCAGQCAACPSVGVGEATCVEARCVASACREGYSPCGEGCCPDLWDGEGTAAPVDPELGQGNIPHGRYPSLALDASGEPRICYQGIANNTYALRCSIASAGQWSAETVDSGPGFSGFDPDLSVASDGSLHVAFYRALNQQRTVAYAYRSAQGWSTREVESSLDVGAHVSLLLDAAQQPIVAYRDGVAGNNARLGLVVARPLAETWSFEVAVPIAADDTDVGFASEMVLDAAGNPHISYQGGGGLGAMSLRYVRKEGENWATGIVDNLTPTTSFSFVYNAIALDSQGRPHIAYSDPGAGDLKYARWEGSAWVIESVDSQGDTGWGASLALDAQDHPHITYFDRSTGGQTSAAVKYATWTGAAWEFRTVAPSGGGALSTEAWTSMALDSRGRVHVAYYGAGKVHYALSR